MKFRPVLCHRLRKIFGDSLTNPQYLNEDIWTFDYHVADLPNCSVDLSLFNIKRTSYQIMFSTKAGKPSIQIIMHTDQMKYKLPLYHLYNRIQTTIATIQDYIKFTAST
jgi:hypothetical protein